MSCVLRDAVGSFAAGTAAAAAAVVVVVVVGLSAALTGLTACALASVSERGAFLLVLLHCMCIAACVSMTNGLLAGRL